MEPRFCRLPSEILPERLRRVENDLRPDLLAIDRAADTLALRYAMSRERLADILRFIAEESECCPFLSYSLDVSPETSGIRLEVRATPEGRVMLDALGRAAGARSD